MTSSARTILVVEDNALSLELIRDVLEGGGWVVHTLGSGEVVTEAAAAHRPDVVLLDLGLPGIDGFETMRRLRADPRTRALPVVALTAQAMAGDAERAVAAGFDAYLTKPIEVRTFSRTLDEILTELGPRRGD